MDITGNKKGNPVLASTARHNADDFPLTNTQRYNTDRAITLFLTATVSLSVVLASINIYTNIRTPLPQPTSHTPSNTIVRETPTANPIDELYARLDIHEDFYTAFSHGVKTTTYQKYILLHDTEVDTHPMSIIEGWKSQGTYVAAHFVIGKDGSIYQCVPLDDIAHHAGFGDNGHNVRYDVMDETRDDRRGTQPIGSWARDYGMNSYSVGIELVHVSGSGYYPPEQLEALDALIAYIDAYYGFPSAIIDHKAWRSGNSDTSAEFAQYLANYQNHRSYKNAP